MKPLSRSLALILWTSTFSSNLIPSTALAADAQDHNSPVAAAEEEPQSAATPGVTPKTAAAVEVRKGVVIDAPTPRSGDVQMLGSIALPSEVIQKLDAQQLAQIVEAQVDAKRTHNAGFGEEVVAPTLFFTTVMVISCLLIYFSYRKRREMLDTVRIAIQSGQTLPASFLQALESKPKPTPDSDLRKAVLLIALGLSGMGVLATLVSENAGRAWTIGLVPTLLGIGYLFLWMQSQKRRKAGSNDDPR